MPLAHETLAARVNLGKGDRCMGELFRKYVADGLEPFLEGDACQSTSKDAFRPARRGSLTVSDSLLRRVSSIT